jgi:hypothetical protein
MRGHRNGNGQNGDERGEAKGLAQENEPRGS